MPDPCDEATFMGLETRLERARSNAAGTPNAGSAGAGSASVSGVPNGPQIRVESIIPLTIRAARAIRQKLRPPGTNNLGTAQSAGSTNSGSGEAGSTTTTGVARNQASVSGSRIDGTVQKGPAMQGDAEISAENAQVDKKVKSICQGC